MRPTHRLFNIIQALRSAKQPVLAKQLAEQFEVSVRTIYRDIAELQNQHVPIAGEPGIGYVLKSGFELPPLMLTPDELDAILLGVNWVSKRGDSSLNKASLSLIQKLQKVVPENLQTNILNEQNVAPSYNEVLQDQLDMSKLRDAIRNRQKIRIDYLNAKNEKSQRTIWPFMIAYFDISRIICAWCELKSDFRHFRSDRVNHINYLNEHYDISAEELKTEWQKQQQSCS